MVKRRSLSSEVMVEALHLLHSAEVCQVLGTTLMAETRTTVFSAKAVVKTLLQHPNSPI